MLRLIKHFVIKSRGRSRRNRKFILNAGLLSEALESRILLTGNISVMIIDGDLVIEGDAMDNHMVLTGDVDGLVFEGLDGTTVNNAVGFMLDSEELEGITDDVVVRLGAGNDELSVAIDLTDLEFDDLRVSGGSGNDDFSVDFEGGGPDGDVFVNLGGGDDKLAVEDVSVGGTVFIRGGTGNDEIEADNVVVTGRVDVNSASGMDEVEISGTFGDRVVVNLGSDSDFLDFSGDTNGLMRVLAGTGDDELDITGTFLIDLRIAAGRGNDTLVAQDIIVSDDVVVILGSGDDALYASDVDVVDRTTISTGSGSDLVLVDAASGTSEFGGQVAIRTGGSDDFLVLRGANTFSGALVVAGGRGNDTAEFDMANQFDILPTTKAIETEDIVDVEALVTPGGQTDMFATNVGVDLVLDAANGLLSNDDPAAVGGASFVVDFFPGSGISALDEDTGAFTFNPPVDAGIVQFEYIVANELGSVLGFTDTVIVTINVTFLG